MKSDDKLYFCMVVVSNQQGSGTNEVWKKLYRLNAFDQNLVFITKQGV